MSISFSNRAIAAGLAIAVALWLSGTALFVPAAQAVTVEELQAQIAELTAQLAALTGGTGSCYTFARDLYNGLSGDDVKMLQDYLTGTGHFSFSGGSTGYFGPVTQAAVAAWQTANGVAPAAGYFGPISRAKYATVCGGGTGTTGGTTTLQGGAGSIVDTELVSGLNNEEVGEDEEDVEVAGLEIEVDEGSDIEITAVTLNFDTGTEDGSDNDFNDFEDYADEVSVWLDGEEVARVDGDAFNDDNNYQRTVTLDSGAVIEAEETGDLVVAISAVGNLDSVDVTDEWTVDFTQFRFRDAQGASITETVTENARTFSFEAFATASDVEFKISKGADEINDGHVIDVDATDNTDNVEIFAFDVEIEGDSDVELKDLPLTATMSGTASSLDDMFADLTLTMDGEEIASENAPASTTVLFNDIDTMLSAGETYEFILLGDINDTEAGLLVDGDTVFFTFGETETNDADFDAEDENGDNLANADKTGSAVSEASAVYAVGFEIELVSTSQSKTFESETSGTGDRGTFVIKYKVTAFDGDIYIDNTCTEDNNGSELSSTTSYSVSNDGSNTTTCTYTSTGDTDSGTAFLIDEGTSETLTLSVQVTASDDGTAFVSLEAIGWDDATGGDDNLFDFNLPGDYKTDPVFLDLF